MGKVARQVRDLDMLNEEYFPILKRHLTYIISKVNPLTLGLIEPTKFGDVVYVWWFIQTNVWNSQHRACISGIHIKMYIRILHTRTHSPTNNAVFVCYFWPQWIRPEIAFLSWGIRISARLVCLRFTQHRVYYTCVCVCVCKSYAFVRIHSIRKS